MMMYHPGNDREADEHLIGAKARNLAVLAREGYRVPPFFVVTADAFAEAAQGASSPDELSVPEHLLRQVEADAAKLWPKDTFLAVRSSAVGEDGTELSYAGQLVSFLFARPQDLASCIAGVWRSAYSERVTAYRRHNRIDGDFPRVAVIVQEMIEADASGVAFGIDPVSGDRNATVISAVYGLGEGLVSGELDADTYILRHGNTRIERTIAAKHQRVVFDRNGGRFTVTEDLPSELRNVPVLADDAVAELAEVVARLGRLFGRAQDVEWCIAGGKLHLLQSRPVTGLASLPDTTRERILWDNSNIIESYSGVTTPLTFSFVRDVYSEVYQELCRILGVDQETVARNREIFEMLGLIRGRIYYNLLNWYRVLALLPGYSINARFMEQMMGVRERLEETPKVIPSRRNPYLRLGGSIYRLIGNLISLPKSIGRFQKHLNRTLAPLEQRDLSTLPPDELVALYRSLERSLLQRWRIPILNDFYTMIFFGALKGTIEKWKLDDAGTLHNDLLSGEGGIISTEPMRRLQEIGKKIALHPELAALFRTADAAQVVRALKNYPELHREVEEYIAMFGDRYVGELKLETITPKQNRELIVPMLAGYVGTADGGARSDPERLRREAEETARRRITGPFRRWLFGWLLGQARERVKNRENLRFERTRVFGVVRRIFQAMGERFAAEGVLDHPRDIFWLTKEEIFDFVAGSAVTADLRSLAALRREEFARYDGDRASRPADRFATYGVVYLGNSFRDAGAQGAPPGGGDLSGTPCCPGIVRRRVRVVTDPGKAPPLDGDILVAERTDPGWAPLFPMAGGLLVERGSLLSHSAIVARELGIPAIVGIAGLMDNLADGTMVEMDGARGTIRVLGQEDVA